MNRPLSLASALAGLVFALGATAASAGGHGHAGPGGVEFRRPFPAAGAWSPVHQGMAPRPPQAAPPRLSQSYARPTAGGTGAGFVHPGYGAQRPLVQSYGYAPQDRSGLGAWRTAQRVNGYGGSGRIVRRPDGGVGYGAAAGLAAGYAAGHYAYGGAPTGSYAYGEAPYGSYGSGSAPLVVRYGEHLRHPSYATSGYGYGTSGYGTTGYGYGTTGYGYGSTGYGYGGDFSNAYSSGYDDNQTLGSGTEEVTEDTGYANQGSGAANYGTAGYGYGGTSGWSQAVPPAGGLSVYSPGAYGPGPRIVTIPSYYRPDATSPLGCTCSAHRGY